MGDPQGECGQSDGRVLTYNSKDQNISFKAGGGVTSTMGYFGTGQAERTGAAGATFTNGPLGVASSSVLLLNTSYVRDPSGTLVSQKGLLSTHYYLFDRLGSVVALTDGSGNAVNRYLYDPYGNGLAGTVEAVANPWQFAGGFRDAFSGYTKFGERYFDPSIGRWTQRDPSGMDANSYGYAGANPVNFVDPSGLKFMDRFDAVTSSFISSSMGFVTTAGCITIATMGTGGAAVVASGAVLWGCSALGTAVATGAQAYMDGRITGGNVVGNTVGGGASTYCGIVTTGTKIPGACDLAVAFSQAAGAAISKRKTR